MVWTSDGGQGLKQVIELALALILSAAIGLERQLRRKPAGLRTHTVVGLGAALFLLVSKYGFTDVLEPGRVVLDPSRVAAQIVSGLGFLGAGLIFVRRDAVRGLTTAATVWLTAAVATAAAAGLPVPAVLCTAGYFLVLYALTPLANRLSRNRREDIELVCTYADGQGVLRDVLAACTRAGWSVTHLETADVRSVAPAAEPLQALVQVTLGLRGQGPPVQLMDQVVGLDGVVELRFTDDDD